MSMGAFETATLRMICTRYFEKEVWPVLHELQKAQESMNAQLARLQMPVGGGGENPTAKGADGDSAALAQQIQELREKIDAKADARIVPSQAQFLELADKVGKIPSTTTSWTSEADTTAELEAEAKLKRIDRKLAELDHKVKDVSAKLQLKPDAQDVPLVSQVDTILAKVEEKASVHELHKLAAMVEGKANANKVPTMAQVEKLEAAVARKMDADLCPSAQQVDELAAEMQRKANYWEVVSKEQFQRFSDEVKRKADSGDVVAFGLVEDAVERKLADAVAGKADVGNVPSLAEYKELAAVTEHKLNFLASKVQQQLREGQQYNQCQPAIFCVPQLVEAAWEETYTD